MGSIGLKVNFTGRPSVELTWQVGGFLWHYKGLHAKWEGFRFKLEFAGMLFVVVI